MSCHSSSETMMFKELEGSDSIQPVGPSSTGRGKDGFVDGTGSFHWKWHQFSELCVTAFPNDNKKVLIAAAFIQQNINVTIKNRHGTAVNSWQNNRLPKFLSWRGYTKHRLMCQPLSVSNHAFADLGPQYCFLFPRITSQESMPNLGLPKKKPNNARKQRAHFYSYNLYIYIHKYIKLSLSISATLSCLMRQSPLLTSQVKTLLCWVNISKINNKDHQKHQGTHYTYFILWYFQYFL